VNDAEGSPDNLRAHARASIDVAQINRECAEIQFPRSPEPAFAARHTTMLVFSIAALTERTTKCRAPHGERYPLRGYLTPHGEGGDPRNGSASAK
jgi:hypothetical protein